MKTKPRSKPRATPRPRSAVTVVAGLALATTLAACGSEGGDDTAADPAGSASTPSPSDEPTGTSSPSETGGDVVTIPATGSAGVAEASLVHATEGGGSESTLAFALDSEQAVSDFVLELESGLAEAVRSTVADVARQSPDATPYGAVASIGCEPPRSVAVEAGEAGFEVVPELPKSTVQCLAPVTYVVVFAAPNA